MDRLIRARVRIALSGLVAMAVAATVGAAPAGAAGPVTSVTGSAYGYRAFGISLFGGSQPDTGPAPSVALTSSASNSPRAAQAPSGTVVYGPAYLFTSDAINVSAAGAVGNAGFASSSSTITNVNVAATQPTTTGSEILTASSIGSTCTATSSGTTRGTTITGGILRTDSGWDDGDAVYPEPASSAGGLAEHDPVNVVVPPNPPAGYTVTGHIHLSATQLDQWVLVFNEQPDGQTVNAVHEYFGYTVVKGQIVEDAQYSQGGSILHGHMILGRSVCGVTTAGA